MNDQPPQRRTSLPRCAAAAKTIPRTARFAFSLPTQAQRDELIRRLWQRRVIMLATGADGVRFRPPLTVSRAEIDAAVDAVRDALGHPD